jgi:hypothetical protein
MLYFWSASRCIVSRLFFCHNCSEWDLHSLLPTRKVKVRPNRLRCTAQHTSFLFPTNKLEPAIISPIRVSDDIGSNATGTDSPCSTARISTAAAPSVNIADSNVNEPEESYDVQEYYKVQLEHKE